MTFQSKLKYAVCLILTAFVTAGTVSADNLTAESRAALNQLVAQNPAAAKVKSKAAAVLVFPDVVKAGFIFGAQGGKGILFVHNRPNGQYRTVAASYGLQAGVHGWEIGTGPSVVIVDKGMARSFTTDTMHSGIYAFTFDQRGLMAGLGIQGSKITRID